MGHPSQWRTPDFSGGKGGGRTWGLREGGADLVDVQEVNEPGVGAGEHLLLDLSQQVPLL